MLPRNSIRTEPSIKKQAAAWEDRCTERVGRGITETWRQGPGCAQLSRALWFAGLLQDSAIQPSCDPTEIVLLVSPSLITLKLPSIPLQTLKNFCLFLHCVFSMDIVMHHSSSFHKSIPPSYTIPLQSFIFLLCKVGRTGYICSFYHIYSNP